MGDLSFTQVLGLLIATPVTIYILARLVTFAYFKSRQDYERTNNHGPR